MGNTLVQTIKLIKFNDWSIVPEKNEINPPSRNESRGLRWIKNERIKGICRPYVLGNTIGWVIKSPINLDVEPVKDLQVECNTEELEELRNITSIDFWVKRGSVYIGVKPDGWFRIHQAKINNNWHNLIIPNGDGAFEWRLGWGLEIPNDYVAMITPLFNSLDDLIKVEVGILESKTLHKFNEVGLGMSLAFTPLKKGKLKKGDPIANLFIFPKSVHSIKSEIVKSLGD